MAYADIVTGGIGKCRVFKATGNAVANTVAYTDLLGEIDFQTGVTVNNLIRFISGESGGELVIETTQENAETLTFLQATAQEIEAPTEVKYVTNTKAYATGSGVTSLYVVLYGGTASGRLVTYHGTAEITALSDSGISGGEIMKVTITITSTKFNGSTNLTIAPDVWTSDGSTEIVDDVLVNTDLPVTHVINTAMYKKMFLTP
jgi:hypothetical protein